MATAAARRTGVVQAQDYEEDAFLMKLDPVVAQLQQDVPDAKYDRRSLGQLILQLRRFMEDTMGKNGAVKAFPKLPARLFQDYRPDGPLTVIAAKLHQLRKARDIKRLDFGNIAMRRQLLDMLNQVRKELERTKLLQPPVIHIHESLGDQVPKLKATVQKMGAQVAETPDDPSVTHIIYPFGPRGDPDDGQEYMRVLTFRGDSALVHYWYLPDSYDEYIPREVAPSRLELDKQVTGPWKVYVRWVTDSEKFNEWMNPIDYETEESVEEQEAIAKANGTWKPPEENPELAHLAIPTVAEVMARNAAAPKPAFALPTIPRPGQNPAASPPGAAAAAATAAGKTKSPPSVGKPDAVAAAGAAAGSKADSAAGASGPGAASAAPEAAASQGAAPSARQTDSAAAAAASAGPGPAAASGSAATAAPKPAAFTVPTPAAAAAAAAVPTPATAAAPAAPAPKPAQQAPLAFVPTVAAAAKMTRPASTAAYGAPGAKRHKADHEIVEVEPGPGTRVHPAAVRHVSVEVPRAVTDGAAHTENLSQGQQLAIHGAVYGQVPRATYPTQAPTQTDTPRPSTRLISDLRGSLAPSDPRKHYVPFYSAWFRWDDIHDIEQAALTDFFTGKYASRTPEKYMSYRDSIIQLYRRQPSRRLTITETRRHVTGDLESIRSVWEFLDRWGLINFQALDDHALAYAYVVSGQSVPVPLAHTLQQQQQHTYQHHAQQQQQQQQNQQGRAAAGPAPPPHTSLAGMPTALTQQGPLLNLRPVSHAEAVTAATTGGAAQFLVATGPKRTHASSVHRALVDAAQAAARSSGQPPRIMCSAMPWVECTHDRYHCLKFPSVNLCPAAFNQGRFPPGCCAKDFTRIDRKALGELTDEGGWSAVETLLLLEALELFGERWDKIAEHVGTKTQVQCLLHFLSMPIEDLALDDLERGWSQDGSLSAGGGTSVSGAVREYQPPGTTAVGPYVTRAADGTEIQTVNASPSVSQQGPLPPPHAPAIALPAPPPPTDTELQTGVQPNGTAMDTDSGPDDPNTQGGAGVHTQGQGVLPSAAEMDAAVLDQLTPCFSETTNPIMTQASALSVLLGVRVASEYASTALAELSARILPPPPTDDMQQTETEEQAMQAALTQPLPPGPDTLQAMQAAHTAGVVAAAAKARAMAEQEEREMYRLVNQLVTLQSQKLDLKLKYLADLDQALDAEAAAMDQQRNALMAERIALRDKRRAYDPTAIVLPQVPVPPPTASPLVPPAGNANPLDLLASLATAQTPPSSAGGAQANGVL